MLTLRVKRSASCTLKPSGMRLKQADMQADTQVDTQADCSSRLKQADTQADTQADNRQLHGM